LLFNEQFLRPLFHHFKGTNEQDIDQKTNDIWHTYCDINAKFVDGLLEIK
jgi:trehalose-6-phosphate synthase